MDGVVKIKGTEMPKQTEKNVSRNARVGSAQQGQTVSYRLASAHAERTGGKKHAVESSGLV